MCSTVNLTRLCNTGQSILQGYCWMLTDAEIAQYPTITIYITGISNPVTLTPDIYLTPSLDTHGNLFRCFGFSQGYLYSFILFTLLGNSGTILGDAFMRASHIVFDRTNLKIGFGPLSSCPVPGSTATGIIVASTYKSTSTINPATVTLPSWSLILCACLGFIASSF